MRLQFAADDTNFLYRELTVTTTQYFFIGSAALALIGCIVASLAQNVEMLIGGTTLIGLAASGQQSFAFITGELVPMRVRQRPPSHARLPED